MPYCPKCGVEVDYIVHECPLCEFIIPDIEPDKDEHLDFKIESIRFPQPENFYPRKMIDFKRNTYYGLSLMLLINILLLIFLQIRTKAPTHIFVLLIPVLVGFHIYLFFFLGFCPNKPVSIFAVMVNTFLLALTFDLFNKKLEWFVPVAIPVIIFSALIIIIIATSFNIKKKTSINRLFVIALGLSIFFIIVEIFISLYLHRKIMLFWSVILAAEILAFSLALLLFYHRIPEKIVNKIAKKIHI